MDVPGQVGWSVSGDKTVEFARFPLDFVGNRIQKYNSKVFISRVLNKPHIFITSSNGIKELLLDKSSSFNMGYKDFGYMHDLFGDIFLFQNDEEAYRLRNIVRELFHNKKCDFYIQKIHKMCEEKLKDISLRSSIDIYQTFKELATSICLSLFLDIDDTENYELYKSVSTAHWHGLISVPMNLKMVGWSSSYSKASDAKATLMKVILEKLQNENNKGRFLRSVSEAGFQDATQAAQHVLLFVSALIPKALSSLLTSFIIEMEGESMSNLRDCALKDKEIMDDILLEVQRLRPPFYGGRRVSSENVTIDGYKIPSGTHVAYISRYGNRDADVFDQPDQFIPQRWQGQDKDKRHLVWTFGGGHRSCIGIEFINRILKCIITHLLSRYDWCVTNEEIPPYKTLPVARPKDSVFVSFLPRKSEAPDGEEQEQPMR